MIEVTKTVAQQGRSFPASTATSAIVSPMIVSYNNAWYDNLMDDDTTDLLMVGTRPLPLPRDVHLDPSPHDGHTVCHHTHMGQSWKQRTITTTSPNTITIFKFVCSSCKLIG